jgi:hypothetical protein
MMSKGLVEMPRFLIIQYFPGSHSPTLSIMGRPDPPATAGASCAAFVPALDEDKTAVESVVEQPVSTASPIIASPVVPIQAAAVALG